MKELEWLVLHEPRLDTVLMVEKSIKEAENYPTRKELWRSPPRKIQYQTFQRIRDYLETHGTIVFHYRTISCG